MVDHVNTQVAYNPPPAGNEATKSSNEPAKQADKEKEFSFFGDDGVTFWDMLDVVNPLQHIPIVSTAYRAITGDELDPGARLAGGTLFGGPIGLAASAFNVILENNTGKDAGEHVLAMFQGEEVDVPAQDKTMMAQNEGLSHPINGFAPIKSIPESEADAFAAGEESLRLAQLQEFMNPATTREVPTPINTPVGAGSAGTWAPPANQPPLPFPTERPQAQTSSPAPVTSTKTEPVPANTIVAQPQQSVGFQAKQSHTDSLDALRAFARDMQAQRQQDQGERLKAERKAPVAPPPVPANTAQLSQTSDNGWFADMMSQNMKRYETTAQSGG
ncbi:hypothetical protein GCM10011332_10660 [Terasakiella brassicae]|uniref:Uncharacterized protein n=1 Tax=Terasakiella brassicae TaxID=1634917 RepID=A0A917F803_9PROT|nr:hypothetical protein [Terasakiella brassicae]GGF58945.1 hypothetical protein GCM10011332_10660 [Terasakiella brassicae]